MIHICIEYQMGTIVYWKLNELYQMPTDFAKRLEKSRGAREDTFVKSGKGT